MYFRSCCYSGFQAVFAEPLPSKLSYSSQYTSNIISKMKVFNSVKSKKISGGISHSTQETGMVGRAIAQAVSRWLPIAAAQVRARVWSSGFCDGQSNAGTDFLRVLRFPLPIFIPPNSLSSQSPGAGAIGHWVADVPSGLYRLHALLCEFNLI
jgi:hypothetical protein